VRPGDPLFEILPDPTPMELTEARREVEIARNVFDQAQKKHERSRTLKEQGILATQEWDQADKEIQDARIRLELAQERLALIEKGRVKGSRQGDRVESIIRAPIAGTVLELLVNEGDPVVPLTSYQAGTALTNLADMNTLVFKGTVDEIDVGKLHEGMPAQIKIGALPEAKVEGRIYKISPKSRTAEGATLFDVEIELLPAKDVVLRAGYSANAEIAVREKHGVLLIPERLVTFADGKASVELPGKNEQDPPQKREIKTGLSDGLNVEVADGLGEKDMVVERPPKKIE
jgi:HlyD family secretion protein